MGATAGAAVLEVGIAVDRSGVVSDSTGVVDATDAAGAAAAALVGEAALVDEATELAAAGLDCSVVTSGDAWLLAAAVG